MKAAFKNESSPKPCFTVISFDKEHKCNKVQNNQQGNLGHS